MKTFKLKTVSDQERVKPVEYKIEYENLLNKAQMKAVKAKDGNYLVIAGAGTGKTRTLIYRVARLIEEGVRPQEIVLLTFTRRAAKEMLDRASQLLDERCKKVRGGTFHQFCAQILREYADEAGFDQRFTILDASDTQDVLQIVRLPYKTKHKGLRFPEKSTLYSILSKAKNKQQSIFSVVQLEYPQFNNFQADLEKLALDFKLYKKQNNLLDFDDLLQETKDLLEQNPQIRVEVAKKNKYVLVDEYQDINGLQAQLIKLFSSFHNNVMAVGDDAQGIYAFRGADHKNILEFPEIFSTNEIIKLEQNFRSTQSILDIANNLLEQAKHKYEKNLFTEREQGELPGLVKTNSEEQQSDFIAQYILHLREQQIELNDTAVLFRNSRDSFDLELELGRRGIPYVKYGGQKISEAAHVKDILAHIKVIVNPSDEISWTRILTLIKGIGPRSASELIKWMKGETDLNPTKNYVDKVNDLSKLLEKLKNDDLSVLDHIQQIVNYYTPICKQRFDDHPKRLKDLEVFAQITQGYGSFDQLLEELTLEPIDGTALETEKAQQEESPLVLSTIHSAKGLEWHTVFVMQCLDGIIPSSFSVDDEYALEEELRLLYVACTRAKEQLLLTYPIIVENGFGDYFSNPSRFIKDLDHRILEPWNIVLADPDEKNDQNQLTD